MARPRRTQIPPRHPSNPLPVIPQPAILPPPPVLARMVRHLRQIRLRKLPIKGKTPRQRPLSPQLRNQPARLPSGHAEPVRLQPVVWEWPNLHHHRSALKIWKQQANKRRTSQEPAPASKRSRSHAPEWPGTNHAPNGLNPLQPPR